MKIVVKLNTQSRYKDYYIKERVVVKGLVHVKSNKIACSDMQRNQFSSMVPKVSGNSVNGYLLTPSPLNQLSVSRNSAISTFKKSVEGTLRSLLIDKVDTKGYLSLDELKCDKRLLHSAVTNSIQSNTRKVYSLVSRMTGRIGGNGNGGAIYGELTIGSMQKIIELMKKHTNFNENSRFIDVGCGLGKPNLHVAQDPGVQFSYGVEMERVRWLLGMCNLNQVLDEALNQKSKGKTEKKDIIGYNCVIEHGDIIDADYLDPFTHVYMFDIGFPPKLFKKLSMMFNRSKSPFLICYHSPRVIIDRFRFEVELLIQTQTSMHGSSEGHMGYIYRRSQHKYMSKKNKACPTISSNNENIPCDPMFISALKSSRRDLEAISIDVRNIVIKNLSCSRSTRNNIISPSK